MLSCAFFGHRDYNYNGYRDKLEDAIKYLKEYGLTVIRVANNMVNQHFREVCEFIDNYIKNNC